MASPLRAKRIYYKSRRPDILRKQFMFSCSREMYAHQLRYFYLALLILPCSLLSASALSSGPNSRRRPTLSNAKQAIDESTEKSENVADQLALATSRTEANQYRRGGAYSSDGEDYPYGNLEMNLVRPEREPVHTQITAKYTTSISARPIEIGSLEDAETAEEYVAKAMQMYGTRLREPIHIQPTEGEPQVKLPQGVGEAAGEAASSGRVKYEYYESAPNQQLQHQQQHQHQQQQHQLREHHQQQHQQHEYQQQQKQNQQHEHQQQQQHQQHEYQQQQKQQHEHLQHQQREQQREQHENADHKALLETEMRAQLQHTQLLAEKQLDAQTERSQQQSAVSQQPAPVYEKDPVTRSYEVYDANAAYEGADSVDRHYRTKYVYQPAYHAPTASEQEEKLRVSASTEIPKAEIMKQIEKSVMKYMKEMAAEGKIVAAPQEPQTYYKLVNVPTEEKHIGSTTIRPKYTGTTTAYNGLYNGASGGPSSPAPIPHHPPPSSGSTYSSKTRHHIPKHPAKPAQHYQTETETAYQAPALQPQQQDISDALAPNVEFIYKIKTRAPLQTATVKTISKPYSLPLKGTYDQFDHTAALKNIEEFDLSHVVTTQEPDERPSSASAIVASNKPSKMYFNSEIYHDINSLPYKPEKTRTLTAVEYRKLKASELGADYKGYPGYFAEPASAEADKDVSASSSAQTSDDGYPIMNPYQYILKKEPLPGKYEELAGNWAEAQQPRAAHAKPVFSPLASQKALEYDSYSPKFNNNPEGYGYQHSYKSEREREREPQHGSHKYANRHPSGGKRGKRGGGIPHPNLSKKSVRATAGKDIEASLALRPPPKV